MKENQEQLQDYRRFQLAWLLSHDYTLEDIYSLADEWGHDEELRKAYPHFEELIEEQGFNGNLWPCFNEWKECEAVLCTTYKERHRYG